MAGSAVKASRPSGSGEDALRLWRSQFNGDVGGRTSVSKDFAPSVKGSDGWTKRKISVKKR